VEWLEFKDSQPAQVAGGGGGPRAGVTSPGVESAVGVPRGDAPGGVFGGRGGGGPGGPLGDLPL